MEGGRSVIEACVHSYCTTLQVVQVQLYNSLFRIKSTTQHDKVQNREGKKPAQKYSLQNDL